MKEKYPDNFRLDFAVSREQTNEKGEKMYIQTRMDQYSKELWELLKKDNTYVYMCGLKGMEKGIDDIMVSLAAEDGKNKKEPQLFTRQGRGFLCIIISLMNAVCAQFFQVLIGLSTKGS